MSKALLRIQQLIRLGKRAEAATALARAAEIIHEAAQTDVDEEASFLAIVDASTRLGSEHSKLGATPRQALIRAAVSGWRGDGPCAWPSPVGHDTVLNWAQSQYRGPAEHLAIAFAALREQGLFFDVQPVVFATPCCYCSLDPEFLRELPEEDEVAPFWEEWKAEFDQEQWPTWYKTGLCNGQGSQGPSGGKYYPCVGTCCIWFNTGATRCNWDLPFNPELRPVTASSSSRNTTFISYGGPDAAFAERLHRALERRGVRTWFFPRDATPGAKLHDVMRKAVAEHERVVLICSQHSLGRPGVLNEIEQTLAREAREGGLSLLVPVTLDDYVFSQWAPQRPALRQEILDRVVADFRQASNDARVFERALNRLTGALTRQPAWSPPAIDPASPPPNVA